MILILKKYFGYEEFRPLQKEIMERVLRGEDCGVNEHFVLVFELVFANKKMTK